jgi:hypothetical protein
MSEDFITANREQSLSPLRPRHYEIATSFWQFSLLSRARYTV